MGYDPNRYLRFNVLRPDPELIFIEDIARSLSRQARFNGHGSEFYSVAEHCCIMAELAPESLKRWALLHDAAEAYLGDIVRPIKRLTPIVQVAEEAVLRAVAQRFGLAWPMPEEIKTLDTRVCAAEGVEMGMDLALLGLGDVEPIELPWRIGVRGGPSGAERGFMIDYRFFFGQATENGGGEPPRTPGTPRRTEEARP